MLKAELSRLMLRPRGSDLNGFCVIPRDPAVVAKFSSRIGRLSLVGLVMKYTVEYHTVAFKRYLQLTIKEYN